MSNSHGTPNLPWVVLVEDDEALEQQLAAALESALPHVEVLRTPDPEEALALARDTRSRLLITEAQSLSVDGLTLAACVRKQRPQLPLIFLAEHALHAGLPSKSRFDGSHLVDKPPRLDVFVSLVSRVLHRAPGFHGQIETSGLMDLVQLVAMTTPTGALHVESVAGDGHVWFEDGSIVHAAFGDECGAAAFRSMLRLPSGSFHVEALVPAPERTIDTNITGFLLESACSLDDDCQSGVRAHGVTAAEHFERGMQAVRDKRYAEALPDWEHAVTLDPDNRIYQHNLLRLQRLLETGPERLRVRR
jgi:CheY-like chemotaxis protein